MASSNKHLHMKQRDDRPYPDQRGRLSQIGAVKNIDRAINEVYALKSVYRKNFRNSGTVCGKRDRLEASA